MKKTRNQLGQLLNDNHAQSIELGGCSYTREELFELAERCKLNRRLLGSAWVVEFSSRGAEMARP